MKTMKQLINIPLVFILFFSLTIFSCEKSKEEVAREAVYTYLNENLDDISTYESVKFGTLDSVDKIKNNVPPDWVFQIFHSYRIEENDGNIVLNKEYYILNSQLEVVKTTEFNYSNKTNNYISNYVPVDSVAVDTSAVAPFDTIGY